MLQEVAFIYRKLFPPQLTQRDSNHLCNVLLLFECIASHSNTLFYLKKSQIHFYIHPFLKVESIEAPYENLKLAALDIIESLIEVDDLQLVHSFLASGLVSTCFQILQSRSKFSKNVAMYIIKPIMIQDVGLDYICATKGRIFQCH